MNPETICTNCLRGTMENGVCSYCHKTEQDKPPRNPNTLPDRYTLGGRYYLGRVIGNGGFGITYLALDLWEHRIVIVKELYPAKNVQRDPQTNRVVPLNGQENFVGKCKQRFREEAQVLRDFWDEPSILNVYAVLEENNTIYYSMEFLSGIDLRTYLQQRGRISWDMLSVYVRQVLHTLDLLHAKGLIHRDVSPDNIFLTSMTEVKLIDFGSVRYYANDQEMTALLKRVYAPPEQYYTDGKQQGPWTDIYSLSVTIYFALSGKQPPPAPSRVQEDTVVPITKLCPELPPYVSAAIMKGMSINERERFQSAREMFAALFPPNPDKNSYNTFVNQAANQGVNPPSFSESGKWIRSKLSGVLSKFTSLTEESRTRQPEKVLWRVQCIAGQFQGREFELKPGATLTFGRDGQNAVCYPQNSPGISRTQCQLQCDPQGRLYIQDANSRYGTTVGGQNIVPGQWVKLESGNVFGFAGESYCVS